MKNYSLNSLQNQSIEINRINNKFQNELASSNDSDQSTGSSRKPLEDSHDNFHSNYKNNSSLSSATSFAQVDQTLAIRKNEEIKVISFAQSVDKTSDHSDRLARTNRYEPKASTPRYKTNETTLLCRRRSINIEESTSDENQHDSESENDTSSSTKNKFNNIHERSDADMSSIDENEYLQNFTTNKYPSGTQFIVTHNFTGTQEGDLSIRKNEILTLIEQTFDDWWLFENIRTREQGVVPINHIKVLSNEPNVQIHRRKKQSVSVATLIDAFKSINAISSGFGSSVLGQLSQRDQYKLPVKLQPKMSESNLSFIDLHWRYDYQQICLHRVQNQKILTIEKCKGIPKIRHEDIDVLNRCIRICLYYDFQIISNIHSIRARLSKETGRNRSTEDWEFLTNSNEAFIDEYNKLLIRSNEYNPSKNLYIIIELSQLCQTITEHEIFEVACGWVQIPIDHEQDLLSIRKIKTYDILLSGGDLHETNVLLDSKYKYHGKSGLSGKIDRQKRAHIKFSIESREDQNDLMYDSLPSTSIIVPKNLIRTLSFYRNELACQLEKRVYDERLSTKPIDSIFLSTFTQMLEQPDLIYTINRLHYRYRELSIQEQRKEYVRIYERFIYPLLSYRLLPTYNFHDVSSIDERSILINELVKRQFSNKKNTNNDILSILLDPTLTDKWTPFTTAEICFSLQNYH